MTKLLTFPDGFLWGAATSAPQTEGGYDEDGKALTIFDRWSLDRPQDFYEEVGSLEASDVYHRYVEDVKLMADVGMNSYRTSISWARLLPDGKHVNPKAVIFYNDLIDKLLANHVQPLMNLFHYDMPVLMQDKGRFLNREVVDDFVHYAETAFSLFGDRVKLWSTFNEAKAQPYGGYLSNGQPDGYPPFHHNAVEAAQVMAHLILITAMCTERFKQIVPDGRIGLIEDSVPQIAGDDSAETQTAVAMLDALRNRVLLDPATKGTTHPLVSQFLRETGLQPVLTPEERNCIHQNTVDFVGLTYYRPERVKAPSVHYRDIADRTQIDLENVGIEVHPEGVRMNTSRGWEIRPECVYDIAMDMKNNYNNMPWFLAENGMGVEGESDNIGGTGSTLGLIIAIFIVGRQSQQYKTMAKLTLVPGIFGINEPLIFGLPIVLNPILFIPFVFGPTITSGVYFALINAHIIPNIPITIPWTTPPFLNTFLASGGQIIAPIVQLLCLAFCTLLYIPFVKVAVEAERKEMLDREAEVKAA